MKMRLEDAIVYVLVNAGRGMTTQGIADIINSNGLHIRRDCQPVTSAQVYAVVCRNRSTFVKEGGRILLII